MGEVTSLTPGKLGPEHVVYHAVVELFSWSYTSNQGRRVRFRLNEREELRHFEAAKMVKKSRAGNPKAGENYRMLIAEPDHNPLLTVDLWYRGPSWSQGQGAMVTFEIEEEGFDFLTEYKTADANEEGAEFFVTLIQLDDNGAPVDQQQRARVMAAQDRKKGGPKSKHVAMLCQDADFATWFCISYLQLDHPLNDDQIAARVRQCCEIGSRADLDHDDVAWQRWRAIESQFTRAMRAPS